jgi:hypothetical protein
MIYFVIKSRTLILAIFHLWMGWSRFVTEFILVAVQQRVMRE